MTEEELSRAALTERYPESNMPYDWLAWYKLRDVYRDFKAGKISKDEGEVRKRNIFTDRQKEINDHEARYRLDRHFADFWRKIEEAGTTYRKDPTIDNADRFMVAVYGAGRLERKRPETETPVTDKAGTDE